MVRKFVTAHIFGITIVGFGGSAIAQPNFSDPGLITEITQTNDEETGQGAKPGAWIDLNANIYNDNCDPNNGTPSNYFLPDDTYPGVPNTKWKANFAMILAAYMSNRPVKFFIKGCYGNSPIIANVTIN